MRRITPRLTLAALLTLGLVGTGATAHASPKPADDDIATQLKAIRGVTLTVDKVLPELPDEHYYELTFRQPVDHRHPNKGTFEQRIRILHKSVNRPVVLFATGYDLYTPPAYRSEPTKILDADQVAVEQRFFTPSRPEPTDWSKLNIWQAATDHHMIVQALKKIYKGKWISTGGSKGGMTSVYHHRFYPHDVDGTVAYVAPNNPTVWDNKPYDRFFDTVGNAECRAKLNGLQQEALNRREEFKKLIAAQLAAAGQHFTTIGSIDRDFEATVIDFRWGWWQYNLAAECANIPDRTASTQTLFDYIDANDPFLSDTDESLAEFVPYFYQAATQLGEPDPSTSYLKGLHYPQGLDTSRNFIPTDIRVPKFDYQTMPDIDQWVKSKGSHLMFLYGGNDPWGVKPFRLGPGTKDSYWYSVAGQRHSGSLISVLPAAQKDQAVGALLRWAGLPAQGAPAAKRLMAPVNSYDPLLDKRARL
jgi:hypothetical protein